PRGVPGLGDWSASHADVVGAAGGAVRPAVALEDEAPAAGGPGADLRVQAAAVARGDTLHEPVVVRPVGLEVEADLAPVPLPGPVLVDLEPGQDAQVPAALGGLGAGVEADDPGVGLLDDPHPVGAADRAVVPPVAPVHRAPPAALVGAGGGVEAAAPVGAVAGDVPPVARAGGPELDGHALAGQRPPAVDLEGAPEAQLVALGDGLAVGVEAGDPGVALAVADPDAVGVADRRLGLGVAAELGPPLAAAPRLHPGGEPAVGVRAHRGDLAEVVGAAGAEADRDLLAAVALAVGLELAGEPDPVALGHPVGVGVESDDLRFERLLDVEGAPDGFAGLVAVRGGGGVGPLAGGADGVFQPEYVPADPLRRNDRLSADSRRSEDHARLVGVLRPDGEGDLGAAVEKHHRRRRVHPHSGDGRRGGRLDLRRRRWREDEHTGPHRHRDGDRTHAL